MSSSAPPAKGKKSDALIGSVVNGKYRIVELVASGGMGKIYRAEQIALSRSVALKVLHTRADAEGQDDPYFEKRFVREASILARLQHPNIVTVFDYGAIDGADPERYFISMEYLAGDTLAQRILDQGRLPLKETVRIARQIARGLTEAHAHGVIHRDLKPSNVMLLRGRDGEETAKIVDFGIVKIVGDASQEREDLTQEGSFIGSPKYMAPEQINRGGKIDVRTDVYSFGIILYQCVTGAVPFDAESAIQTLMAHLNQAPDPMRDRAPSADLPDWLDLLVTSCMEKDPQRRPQTMDLVAKTLGEAEAAMVSGRLLGTVGLPSGSSVPAASGSSSGSASETSRRSTSNTSRASGNAITTQGTSSSLHPAPTDSETTRASPRDPSTKSGIRRAAVLLAFVGCVIAAAVLFLQDLRRPAASVPNGAPAGLNPPFLPLGSSATTFTPLAAAPPSSEPPGSEAPRQSPAIQEAPRQGSDMARQGPLTTPPAVSSHRPAARPAASLAPTASTRPNLDIRMSR